MKIKGVDTTVIVKINGIARASIVKVSGVALPVISTTTTTTSGGFTSATGGTVTTSGNYKIHTFTSVGSTNFVVSTVGTAPNNKFEILFELACQAIRDRYYREAIISFASAKEEFYLYYISIIFHSEHKDFQDFKDINCQSERLLGAFSYAYQLKNGKKFLINDENTKLRNKVVHKGYIPKEQETLSFADDVFKLINLNMNFLKDNFQEICTKYTFKTITERTQKAKEIEEKNKTTEIESIISGTGWQSTILSSISNKTENNFKILYECKYGKIE